MFAGLLKILVTLGLCLLARVVQATETECLDRFNPPPTDVIVPEGDVRGVFKCHYCKADNVGWLWNGSPIDENAYRIKGNITVGSMFSDGTELKNLTVLALPGFDGTPVQCYASLANGSIVYSEPAAHFCVIEPPGPIENLTVECFRRIMSLFWEQPPNTTPFPISLCIDVYNDTVDGPQFLQRQCDVPANQSRYPITVPEPDPEVLYLIVVTPRYDVTGANSGNSTNVTAFFVGEPLELPKNSMTVSVNITEQIVFLVIVLSNADAWIRTGHKVDSFLVKVVHDNHVECLRRIQSEFADIVNSTITLQLSCPNLPMQAVFTVFVTATNKVGNVTLSSQYDGSLTTGSSSGNAVVTIIVSLAAVALAIVAIVAIVIGVVCLVKYCKKDKDTGGGDDGDPPMDDDDTDTDVGDEAKETKPPNDSDNKDSGCFTASTATASVEPQDRDEIGESGNGERFKSASQSVQDDKKSYVSVKAEDNMNDSEGIFDRSFKGQATSAEGDLDGYSKKVLPSLQLKVQQPPKDKVEENGTPECSISMEESGNEEDLGNTSNVALFMGMAGDQ